MPEHQEPHPLHLSFLHRTKNEEDIAAHQRKNFKTKKYSKDEHISPRRSSQFMKGRKPKRLQFKISIPRNQSTSRDFDTI